MSAEIPAPPEIEKISLPNNILVVASHGSAELPEDINVDQGMFPLMGVNVDLISNPALWRDYTDFATGNIVDHFETDRKVPSPWPRIAGDPNRAEDAPDIFKPVTFNKMPAFIGSIADDVATDSKKPWQEWLIEKNHRRYYEGIQAQLDDMLATTDGSILMVDIHDTGEFEFSADGTEFRQKEEGFPGLILSDRDGKATEPGVMDDLEDALSRAFERHGIDIAERGFGGIEQNTEYKGGYVTQHFGEDTKTALREAGDTETAARINFVQFELNRSLYMDEETQEIDEDRLTAISVAIGEALQEVGSRLAEADA